MIGPIADLGIATAFAWVALNAPQGARPYFMIPITLFSVTCFVECGRNKIFYPVADTLAKGIFVWCLHMASVLLVQKWTVPEEKTKSWMSQLHATYKMVFNLRWLGTPQVAPGLRPSPPAHLKMGRFAFVRNRLSYLIVLACTESMTAIFFLLFIGREPSDYLPSKDAYLRRLLFSKVTSRETVFRAFTVFSSIRSGYAVYTGLHAFLAILFVGSGIDEPADWPPLFGRWSDSYTLRSFWSKFSDRLIYRTITTWLKLLLKQAFGFGSPSRPWNGWRRVVLNFLICGGREELEWFLLNFLVVAAESSLGSYVWRRWPGKASRLEKAMGYLWVLGFMFLSVPKFQYPQMRCPPKSLDSPFHSLSV